METDTLILLLAAALIAVAQVFIVVTVRPRPRTAIEIGYLALPAAGVSALVVFAFRSVA